MVVISFLHGGAGEGQTTTICSVAYELGLMTLQELSEPPAYPLVQLVDYSNMHDMINILASEKVLIAVDQASTLFDCAKGGEKDWSRCCYPTRLQHAETKRPIFFITPFASRGTSLEMTSPDAIGLLKLLFSMNERLLTVVKYFFYDVPAIVAGRLTNNIIPPLAVSDLYFLVVGANQQTVGKVIEAGRSALKAVETGIFEPPIEVTGFILTQEHEKAKSEKWADQISMSLELLHLGSIDHDPQVQKIMMEQNRLPVEPEVRENFPSIAKQYETLARKIKVIASEETNLRKPSQSQIEKMAQKIT